jgi:micrococcal nuclease
MRHRITFTSLTLAILGAGAAHAAACAPPVEVANVPITEVEPNGMLVTNDGRAVKREGLLLPGGARDHAPQYLQQQALAELSDLTHGHLANLDAMPPKEDRYGRLRAQVFVDGATDQWVQTAMLSRGLARVSITPDRPECASELYAAESAARTRHVGIWTLSAYAVRPASDVPLSDLGTFQIVEGKVTTATLRSGRAYLNFGADWKTDFTATIAQEDMKNFRDHDIDPATFYAGKTLRVRGVVEQLNGPEIEVATPEQIEILPDLRPRTTN